MLGIGVTGPTARLEIGCTAGTDGIKFPDGSLQTSSASSHILIVEELVPVRCWRSSWTA